MPCVVIGIDKWMKDNRSTVDGFLKAALAGGDAVKASDANLHQGAAVSAVVYNDQNADYWEKYYKGTVEKDKTGVPVDLGGSKVNGLSDALLCFGMVPGSQNLFAATYTVFGDLVVSQYPELVPSIPPVSAILDESYLNDIRQHESPAQKQATQVAVAAAKPKYVAKAKIKRVVSRKNWRIGFNSGKATFTPSAKKELEKLMRDLLVASGTSVEVDGHTDNTGNAQANLKLSEARAFAVKNWLEKQSHVNFPASRIRVVAYGQTRPLVPNTTPAGQAQNRRVEIIIGTV
jgi:OOP family OmpA-OmpF porin